MISSRVIRAFGCQCQSRNSPGFETSILRDSGIWGAAEEAVLNNVHNSEKFLINTPCKKQKISRFFTGIS
jgi:hypothetical protein